jgi:hypothetical protein
MTKRNRILPVFAILVLWMSAAQWTRAQTAAAPATDAVVLKQVREYTLAGDGSVSLHVYEQKKLLTGYAMNRLLGETFIPFNRDGQELKVNRCVTTMVDGTKVPTPENGFNEITHPRAFDFPELSGQREMVVSHTGLEIGAVTELDYTITSKPGFQPFLEGVEPFGGTLPVQEMIVTVSVPRTSPLGFASTGGVPKPVVRQEGGNTRYEWRAANLPIYPEERLAPARETVVPTLFFTTARSGAERMGQLPPAELSAAAVKEMLGGEELEPPSMILLLKVQDAVDKGTRLVHLPLSSFGAAVAPPQKVFARCYGTDLERALLLEALLKAAGFSQARLLAATPAEPDWAKVPVLEAVSRWWVRVTGPGFDLRVDPDGGLAPVPDSGPVVLRDARTGEAATVPPAGPDRLTLQCRVQDWKEGRCKLEGSLEMSGGLVDAGKLARDAAKEAEKAVQECFPGWDLEKVQVQVHAGGVQGLSCSFTAESAKVLTSGGEFRYMDIPVPPAVGDWRELYRVPDRRTDVQLPVAPLAVRMELSVAVPPGLKAEYLPPSIKAQNTAAMFSQEISVDGERIIVHRSTDVPKARLTATECGSFRQAVAPWFLESQSGIILKTAK